MKISRRARNSVQLLMPLQFAKFWLILTVTLTLINGGSVSGCFQGIEFLGRTYPSGDIVLHVGDPLELFCSIDLEKAKAHNYSVENLLFEKNGQPIDPRYITRVNSTTIRLYMENQEESVQMYYCYLKKPKSSDSSSSSTMANSIVSSSFNSLEQSTSTARETAQNQALVCMNMVLVATEPKEVENFSCIAYNWQRLNCSWQVPKNNIPTNYSISYFPNHRYRETANCPTDDDVNFNYCVWSLSSKPVYRNKLDVLKMNVTGVNKFNKTEQIFVFNQFKDILLDEPKELRLQTKNMTSITLQWNIGDLQYFPKALEYKILYKYRNDSDWNMSMCNSKNVTRNRQMVACTVSNLIPSKLYNFRVYMKSALAADKYWSKYASVVLRTNSSHPPRSPRTDVGSFQIERINDKSDKRLVFVYWQPLLPDEHYGDNFHYDIKKYVVTSNGGTRLASDIQCDAPEYSYIKCEIDSFKYLFEIRSINNEGQAPTSTSVIIPSSSEEVEPCVSFTKTDYKTDNKKKVSDTSMQEVSTYEVPTIEVSWQPPANEQVDNYTIFWCKTDRDRPYQCNGFIEWLTVDSDRNKHNFSLNTFDLFQFAISANTPISSSGMMWATCTVLHDTLGIVRHVDQKTVGSTFITLSWKLECSDQANTIEGYLVTYCPTAGRNKINCTGPELEDRVNGTAHTSTANITRLQPFTYYNIRIRMFAGEKLGKFSQPVVLGTLEGEPDVDELTPRVMRRTNNSVTIGWEVPRRPNGVIRHYEVQWYRKQMQKSDPLQAVTTQTDIQGLEPFTNYTVEVKACTKVCSKPMKPIVIQTRIGRPGPPTAPTVDQEPNARDNRGSEVRWNPPAQLAGPQPSYELYVLKNSEVISNRTTSNTYTRVTLPDCNSDHGPGWYELKVRAINVDKDVDVPVNGEVVSPMIYVGDWSPVYALNCSNVGISIIWKILFWTMVPTCLILSLLYGGRKGFYKCRQMKNVQVTIPMKFVLSSSSVPPDSKEQDIFGNSYSIVLPPRPADELSTLVEKTVQQPI